MMTDGWSWYSIFIIALNLGGCAWLLMWTRKNRVKVGRKEEIDHGIDGITEFNNPLPLWWFYTFWATIVFAIGYLLLFPGLGNNNGYLDWSSHKELAADIAAVQERKDRLFQAYAEKSVEELINTTSALATGQRIFANNCSTCHGADAQGAVGYPNLSDKDWLHGNAPEKIKETITHGRKGSMPAFATDLSEDDKEAIYAYFQGFQGKHYNIAKQGKKKFQTTCAACHGLDAKGNHERGAPNLTDNIWLHGGSKEAIFETINHGRSGEMPAHKELLSTEEIHLLTAYVLSLSHDYQ